MYIIKKRKLHFNHNNFNKNIKKYVYYNNKFALNVLYVNIFKKLRNYSYR